MLLCTKGTKPLVFRYFIPSMVVLNMTKSVKSLAFDLDLGPRASQGQGQYTYQISRSWVK